MIPKVVVIGGYGRSGSTLIDKFLGNVDGVISTGELRHIWDRGLTQNQLCGCGEKFRECNFWNPIIETFFCDEEITIEHILSIKNRVDRMRFIPALLCDRLRTRKWNLIYREFSQLILKLYQVIQTQSDCEIIIDSSKDPSYIYLLNSLANQDLLDLTIIHLVRDSRAVAYSWQRIKKRPEIHWQNEYMPIYSPMKSAFEWMLMNLLISCLGLCSREQFIFMRYEDLVEFPNQTISKLLSNLKISSCGLAEDATIQADIDHTISGNPMRFQRGEIKIKPDNEWTIILSNRQKRLITFLTYPLLYFYRYI